MLRRARIIATELLVACLVVVVAVLFWASYYVDTEEFHHELLPLMEAVVGEPVSINGGLDIALYPSVSLRINGLVISGPKEFGDTPLAEIDAIYVGAYLLPLVNSQLELKPIHVEGMTLNIIRSDKGKFNWSRTISRPAAHLGDSVGGDGGIKEIVFNGIDMSGTTINFANLADGNTFTLSGLGLNAEPTTEDNTIPFDVSSSFAWEQHGVDAKFSLSGVLGLGLDGSAVSLSKMKISSELGGIFLPGKVAPALVTSNVSVDLEKRKLALENIVLEFAGVIGRGRLETGPLDSSFQMGGAFTFEPFEPGKVISQLVPSFDPTSTEGLKTARFHTNISVTDSGIDLTGLVVDLDDQHIQGRLGLVNFSDPSVEFDLASNKLDVDRYLSLFASETNTKESGAPLVWQDIPLDLVPAIKVLGTVAVDTLRVSGEDVSKFKISVNGLKQPFQLDMAGVAPTGEPVSSHTEVAIGKDEATGFPILEASAAVDTVVGHLLWMPEESPVAVEADGRLHTHVQVGPVVCNPEGELSELLKHVKGSATLVYDKGLISYTSGKEPISLKFNVAEGTLKFKSADVKGTDYGFDTQITFNGNGGEKIHVFSFSSAGVVGFLKDESSIYSPGLDFGAAVAGTLYTSHADRVSVKANVAFDSAKSSVDIRNASLRTLETTVNASISLENMNKSFKGRGSVEIPNANVRRIIYLLSDYGMRTQDVNALKALRIKTDVSLDAKGFQLDNFDGDLDGMPIVGQIAGEWAANPKLLFVLKGGKLDIDRYLPPSEPATGEDPDAPYDPVELPLSFFRWLNLKGTAELDELKLIKTRVQKVQGIIEAENGDVHVSNVTGRAYRGRLTADWQNLIREKDLTTDLVLNVKGMQAGPFMVDVAKRDYVQGKTDMVFKLSSQGLTDFDIVKNLNGKISLKINDGSYKFTGYDLPHSNVAADQKRNEEIMKRRTHFRKASSSIVVSQGVLNIDSLAVDAPVVSTKGNGLINLPEFLIDLSLRNDFVAVPSVTVRIVGDLGSPSVKVPKDKIVSDTVINILSLPLKSIDVVRDIFK